jgi:hypothetical protein
MRLIATTFSAFLVAAAALGAPNPYQIKFFEQHVRPVLSEHCYKCHSAKAEKLKGGLLLDTRAGWMNGGDNGSVIVPGQPEKSRLIAAVRHADKDLTMPPKKKLTAAQIGNLVRWIRMGAPDPRAGKAPPPRGKLDVEAGRSFWAFQPLRQPKAPAVRQTNWPADPLDRFVLAKLEAKRLKPVAAAERETLIRRATFDLIGLPPTPGEIRAFVQDKSPEKQAFAKVVDRLLASRHFGERWGRHWLDVVRYAESTGRTRNLPYIHAWRYRDYVITSFNQDKPFNRFVQEQLAGDLLPAGASPKQVETQRVATGFLALGSHDLNVGNTRLFRSDVVDDQVDTTGRAILGLTLGCARCHDHKFDPLPTADYYAIAGMFYSTEMLIGHGPRRGGKNTFSDIRLMPIASNAASAKLGAELAELERKAGPLVGRERNLKNNLRASKNNKSSKQAIAAIQRQLRETQAKLKPIEQKLAALKKKLPKGPMAMGVRDRQKAADTRIHVRGDPLKLGAPAPRGFIQVLNPDGRRLKNRAASGRLELARWMTDPQTAAGVLAARVKVNRVWGHLFGRALVRTVDNFGATGARPTHPELLDHLAGRFIDAGWRLKPLIKSIMLSRTYRLAASHQPANHDIDPDNVLLWRMNARRIEAEALRDAILQVSGQLNRAPPNGSPAMNLDPVKEIRSLSLALRRDTARHRSVYQPIIRGLVPDMFETFDFAEPSSVTGRRDVTTVATQALFMMNNKFVTQHALHAATLLLKNASADDPSLVKAAYRRALGREPSTREAKRAVDFVNASKKGQGDAAKREAWAGLFHALFSSAEFRYLN